MVGSHLWITAVADLRIPYLLAFVAVPLWLSLALLSPWGAKRAAHTRAHHTQTPQC